MKQFSIISLVCGCICFFAAAFGSQTQTDQFLDRIQKNSVQFNEDIHKVKKNITGYLDSSAKLFDSEKAVELQTELTQLMQEVDAFQGEVHEQLNKISQQYQQYTASEAKNNKARAAVYANSLIPQLTALDDKKKNDLRCGTKSLLWIRSRLQRERLRITPRLQRKKGHRHTKSNEKWLPLFRKYYRVCMQTNSAQKRL